MTSCVKGRWQRRAGHGSGRPGVGRLLQAGEQQALCTLLISQPVVHAYVQVLSRRCVQTRAFPLTNLDCDSGLQLRTWGGQAAAGGGAACILHALGLPASHAHQACALPGLPRGCTSNGEQSGAAGCMPQMLASGSTPDQGRHTQLHEPTGPTVTEEPTPMTSMYPPAVAWQAQACVQQLYAACQPMHAVRETSMPRCRQLACSVRRGLGLCGQGIIYTVHDDSWLECHWLDRSSVKAAGSLPAWPRTVRRGAKLCGSATSACSSCRLGGAHSAADPSCSALCQLRDSQASVQSGNGCVHVTRSVLHTRGRCAAAHALQVRAVSAPLVPATIGTARPAAVGIQQADTGQTVRQGCKRRWR